MSANSSSLSEICKYMQIFMQILLHHLEL
jgi:hypothetical protein